MSGYYEEDFENYDEGRGQSEGTGLRKLLEEALAANKKLTGELETERRQTKVTGLLESKGIDPAVANIIPKDAKADEWLDQYGHLFAPKATQEEEPSTPKVEETQQPDPALLEEQRAWERANGIEPTGTSTSEADDPFQKVQSFTNEQDLLEFIRSQGGGPSLA